jgi:hypothetical protein
LGREWSSAMSNAKQVGGVTIGNVSGGIHGSVIAGQNVSGVTITIGDRAVAADKEPNADELKELLLDIQRHLGELAAHGEALGKLSPSAPLIARSAEVTVKDAVEKFKPQANAGEAESLQSRLKEASSFVTTILDGAKGLADKAGEAGKALAPIVEKAAPLLEKLGVAAVWAAKLYFHV